MILPKVDNWSVAWTKSRCEKALAEYFVARDVACFLPLVTQRRQYGARLRTSQIPLFSGYLFFDGDSIARPDVFESRKVAEILAPKDSNCLACELENIAVALRGDETLRETRFGQMGKTVSVVRGPLKGLVGELVRLGSDSKIIVRVQFIGKAVELNIDEAFLEPV